MSPPGARTRADGLTASRPSPRRQRGVASISKGRQILGLAVLAATFGPLTGCCSGCAETGVPVGFWGAALTAGAKGSTFAWGCGNLYAGTQERGAS